MAVRFPVRGFERCSWASTRTRRLIFAGRGFDGFLVRAAQVLSYKAIPIQEVSDHFPASLTIAIALARSAELKMVASNVA